METVAPIKFAHVVLPSRPYQGQINFHQLLLGARIVHGDEVASFLSYDNAPHRIAITNMPELIPQINAMAGVDHYAFTYANLDDLLCTYQRMKAAGHTPVRCTNPIGVNLDPDEMVEKRASGASREELAKKRPVTTAPSCYHAACLS